MSKFLAAEILTSEASSSFVRAAMVGEEIALKSEVVGQGSSSLPPLPNPPS